MAHCFGMFVWLALTVAVVATGGTASQATGDWPIADYLRVPRLPQDDKEAFYWIKESSKELGSEEPQALLEFLRQTRAESSNNFGKINYRGEEIFVGVMTFELLNLADTESLPTWFTVDYFGMLVEYVYGSLDVMSRPTAPDHDVALFNYLQHYAKQKFQFLLANKFNEEYEKIMKQSEATFEETFDKLVASQEQGKKTNNNDDEHLAQVARQIDLIGGQFDARKMLQVAKEIKKIRSSQVTHEYLTSFIDANCHSLFKNFDILLSIVNMNRLLDPTSVEGANLPDKLIKINEYSRICHQLDETSDKREQVLENIENNLAGRLTKMFKKIVNRN